jgi:hypothetical protein
MWQAFMSELPAQICGSRRHCIQHFQTVAGEGPETLQVDDPDGCGGCKPLSELFDGLSYRRRNVLCAHDGNRHYSFTEVLRISLGLQNRLGKQWDDAITAALRRSFDLDEVFLAATFNDEVRPFVIAGTRALDAPGGAAERVDKNSFEIVFSHGHRFTVYLTAGIINPAMLIHMAMIE